jgi:hypothetical protein
MDFGWVTEMAAGLPPEFRFLVILAVLGIIYKWADVKYINPKGDGDGALASDLSDKVDSLELHLTNHLTSDVRDLKNAIIDMAQATRDMKEELNRNVNTMTVLLTKNDQMRDILIEVRGKVN